MAPFDTVVKRTTKGFPGNFDKTYKLELAGPAHVNADYLNIYIQNPQDLYHNCMCLKREDITWLRDELIKRYPVPIHSANSAKQPDVEVTESKKGITININLNNTHL